jgi:hypothetical protein
MATVDMAVIATATAMDGEAVIAATTDTATGTVISPATATNRRTASKDRNASATRTAASPARKTLRIS